MLLEWNESRQNAAGTGFASHRGDVLITDTQGRECALQPKCVEKEFLGFLDGLLGDIHGRLVGVNAEDVHAVLDILAHGVLAQAILHPARSDNGEAQAVGDSSMPGVCLRQ